MRPRRSGPAILYPFRCRIGSTAPSRAGFRNLFECQLVASARLGFTVSDHAAHEQIGIIESRAKRVCDRIAEFAAFVNRARAYPAMHGWGHRPETKTA